MLTISKNHSSTNFYEISKDEIAAARKKAEQPARMSFLDRLWQRIAGLFPKNEKEQALEKLTTLYKLHKSLSGLNVADLARAEGKIYKTFKELQALAESGGHGNFIFERNSLVLKTDDAVQEDEERFAELEYGAIFEPDEERSLQSGEPIFEVTLKYCDGRTGKIDSMRYLSDAREITIRRAIQTATSAVRELSDQSTFEEIQKAGTADATTKLKLHTHLLALRDIAESGQEYSAADKRRAKEYQTRISLLRTDAKRAGAEELERIRLELIRVYRDSAKFMQRFCK